MVEQIKNMEREDRLAWWAYCDLKLDGVRDPNRHEEHTLRGFLTFLGGATPQAASPAPSSASTDPAMPQSSPWTLRRTPMIREWRMRTQATTMKLKKGIPPGR